jgi:hypothetical protein
MTAVARRPTGGDRVGGQAVPRSRTRGGLWPFDDNGSLRSVTCSPTAVQHLASLIVLGVANIYILWQSNPHLPTHRLNMC